MFIFSPSLLVLSQELCVALAKDYSVLKREITIVCFSKLLVFLMLLPVHVEHHASNILQEKISYSFCP